jgi:hypothetical protein
VREKLERELDIRIRLIAGYTQEVEGLDRLFKTFPTSHNAERLLTASAELGAKRAVIDFILEMLEND